MKLFQKLIKVLNRFKLKPTKSVLNGKNINLTGDNTIITSNNFNVDKDGNMSCNNATMHDISINSAIMNNSQIQGGNLKMWGNTTNDGVRVFSNNTQNKTYMAYMVSDSIGVNKGSHSASMLSDAITVGESTMYEDHIVTPYLLLDTPYIHTSSSFFFNLSSVKISIPYKAIHIADHLSFLLEVEKNLT